MPDYDLLIPPIAKMGKASPKQSIQIALEDFAFVIVIKVNRASVCYSANSSSNRL